MKADVIRLFDKPLRRIAVVGTGVIGRVGEVTDKRTEALLCDFVEAFEVFVAPCSRGAHA